MEKLTIGELLEAVNGHLLGDFNDLTATVETVETDSRTITPGSLFIPLVGERFDGHAYIDAALEGGAAGCFTQRERESYLPGKFYIKVESTHRSLRDLAVWYRRRFHVPVVAVTGSVGKTTTKDMIAAVLSERFDVLKTDGNKNNDIGLPMTLLRLESHHQIAVVELGINHPGEMDYLSGIAQPDVVCITNIGDSHIENFGCRENTLAAKAEIFNHAKAGALAVLNGDDPLLLTLKGKTPGKVLFCGKGEEL
ncbi:MAG: UDP-N-acetylmuramoyl-tripeptide--D-alanyl-D-alanine ligase, partial [Oscillospiraceae bacterium]|nr:UDP-N-acetylmuramoyl-tripeptide--D-alanyl-D-alanine ligase [Oscillospiraceae bacterium]